MIGFDCGTYNLVRCRRDKAGNFQNVREINCFFQIPLDDRYTFNILKTSKVPVIERPNYAYAMGEAALRIAFTMGKELKRPMRDGCVNPTEREAFDIMKVMIHSLIGEIEKDQEVLYYCVPANAVNEKTDATFHAKLLEQIFKKYKSSNGHILDAHSINEAQALVFAELANKQFTGVGISFGAGMVNLCYCVFGVPAFQFSIVNSGDWIDTMAAKATGESPTFINQAKTEIDLGKEPTNLVERAIQTQYRIMIEHTVHCIKKGLVDAKKGNSGDVDIVIAGGTSSPPGFKEQFEEVVRQADLPIKLGKVIRPEDPLYSVARGCLIAAEMHQPI
jgi:hypothetical protein